MRISDWSSDVCSSDLGIFQPDRLALGFGKEQSGVFGEKIREPGPVLCIDITEIARLQCLYFQYGCYIFRIRSEEHTSELQSLMRRSYAVFCLKKNNIR